MARKSTRCHAAVINGEVFKNVIVAYEGTLLAASKLEIMLFMGEIHSTDDFNGAVIVVPIGFQFHIDKYRITCDNFSSMLDRIASEVPPVSAYGKVRLIFLPL